MRLGMVFPREFDPGVIVDYARQLDAAGADDLWVIEDCFYTSAIALAATALAHSGRLTVGIGITPAPLRNPVLLAMELATLARLAPGRLVAGIGHGVQTWMAQVGVRPDSPVTALTEVVRTVRALLAGERVTFNGRYVRLDDVGLTPPPQIAPPVIVGASGPKSLAAAGRHADGLLLAELSSASGIAAARSLAGAGADFPIRLFSFFALDDDRRLARRRTAGQILDLTAGGSAGMTAFPFLGELQALASADDRPGAVERLVDAPDEWWIEFGAIGDTDDVLAHIAAVAAAGAHSLALFPAPDLALSRRHLSAFCETILPATRSSAP